MMKEPVDINNNYELLEQIGQGSYASVHKAINKLTGEICAIKKIRSTSNDLNNFNQLISEIGIISKCRCENIVKFLAYGDSTGQETRQKEVSIVMEYCCGGSVKDVMKRLGKTISLEQLVVIARDVLRGLDYLHSTKRIHRDVKAANILLNEEGIAKLGDFGVSESSSADATTKKAAIIGTLLWVPPEVARADPNYSTAIDIWSLGITLIEMGDGQPPYSKLSEEAVLSTIGNMDEPPPCFEKPSKWPQELLDLLNKCLQKDASKRKTARELLESEIMLKAPPNERLKELVAESTSTANQKEAGLFKRYRSLLKENISLCNIYEYRQKKVIRVDQMLSAHRNLSEQFASLSRSCQQKNENVVGVKRQVRDMEDEIQRLEKRKRELVAKLESKQRRGRELRDELAKIKKDLDARRANQ